MPLAPNACDNCGDPVQVRRPSKTGKHFCKKTPCQTAKHRHYREAVTVDAKAELADFVRDALHGRRTSCDYCGLEDAIPGWVHRTPGDPGKPCFGAGARGSQVPGVVIDAVHPELAPGA